MPKKQNKNNKESNKLRKDFKKTKRNTAVTFD